MIRGWRVGVLADRNVPPTVEAIFFKVAVGSLSH
jgi:hypothetical protein